MKEYNFLIYVHTYDKTFEVRLSFFSTSWEGAREQLIELLTDTRAFEDDKVDSVIITKEAA